MSRTNRGQAAITPIGTMITAIVIGVVSIIGIQVMSSVQKAQDVSPEEVQHLCNGMWGCSGPVALDLLPLLLVPVGILALSLLARHSRAAKGTDQTRIQFVKEQYVNGDIETVVALEDELEDTLDGRLNWGEE